MNLDYAFLSTKRRYKVLLREEKSKPSGGVDPLVTTELRALEEKFPELKQLRGETVESGVVSSSSPGNDKVSNYRDDVTSLGAHEKDDAGKLQTSLTQICNNTEDHVVPRNYEGQSTKLRKDSEMNRFFLLVTFTLNLYNEFHQRSTFDPLSYVKVLICSVFNALFHAFVCDPCSPLGMNIMPSLFCFMIHLNNLYSLYIRQRGHVSISMLLVYLCLDFIPSLVAAFVFYSLMISSLNKLFAVNLNFQCSVSS